MAFTICGIPYIILEGNDEDYREILKKINFLRKYDFEWYVDRITPHIIKMIEAKEGKTMVINYFRSIIQDKKITESFGNNCLPPQFREKKQINYIQGWILDFFGYYGKEKEYRRNNDGKIKI